MTKNAFKSAETRPFFIFFALRTLQTGQKGYIQSKIQQTKSAIHTHLVRKERIIKEFQMKKAHQTAGHFHRQQAWILRSLRGLRMTLTLQAVRKKN